MNQGYRRPGLPPPKPPAQIIPPGQDFLAPPFRFSTGRPIAWLQNCGDREGRWDLSRIPGLLAPIQGQALQEGRPLPKGWHQMADGVGKKWHQDKPESAGEMAHQVGRAVAARHGPRCASPARPCPGSATRGRGPGAGGRWARPLPPGLRLGLTSLTSPCQSLSVRSLFMASSCRRGRAAWTPPSSACDSLSPAPPPSPSPGPREGPAPLSRCAAASCGRRAVDSTSASAGGRGGGAVAARPQPQPSQARSAPRSTGPPTSTPARTTEGRGSLGLSPEVTPDPSIIALEGGR